MRFKLFIETEPDTYLEIAKTTEKQLAFLFATLAKENGMAPVHVFEQKNGMILWRNPLATF